MYVHFLGRFLLALSSSFLKAILNLQSQMGSWFYLFNPLPPNLGKNPPFQSFYGSLILFCCLKTLWDPSALRKLFCLPFAPVPPFGNSEIL